MSQENVELTLLMIEATNPRDVEAVIALSDPEGVLYPAIEALTEGRSMYRGHAGLRQYYQDLEEFAEESHFEPSEAHDLGDQVLVLGRLSMRFTGGPELDHEAGAIFTWRNGKCVEVATWLSHAETLEAAGLRDSS
jgi:ketosteroid isomerase-like protein